MTVDAELLRAAVLSFESASRSLESCRITLGELMSHLYGDDEDQETAPPAEVRCSHPDAIETVTMGGNPPLWLCPDCGDQFQ